MIVLKAFLLLLCSPESEICNATVLTNRPLNNDELFEVRIDKICERFRKNSALSIGVTSVAPHDLKFERDMSKSSQGRTWLFSGTKVYYQRSKVDEVNGDLDELQVGQGQVCGTTCVYLQSCEVCLSSTQVGETVAVMRSQNTLKFFVAGSLQASVRADDVKDVPLFGYVDVFGKTRQVTIAGMLLF